MKWSERIAQGFSPGYDAARCALPVRRSLRGYMDEGGKVATGSVLVVHGLIGWPRPNIGCHFQGTLLLNQPRVETLGYSVRPFHGQEPIT
jgi:hypothetical protein